MSSTATSRAQRRSRANISDVTSKRKASPVSVLTERTETATKEKAVEAVEEKVRPSLQLRIFRVMLNFGMIVLLYTGVMTCTSYVIPVLAAALAKQSGLRSEYTFDQIFATWILPLTFVTGMLFVGVLVLIRFLWRWSRKVSASAADWPLMQKYDKELAAKAKAAADDSDDAA